MGKKSRRNKKGGCDVSNATAMSSSSPASNNTSVTPATAPLFYPSDGPSDVELLQTTSSSLQTKLDQLTQLGLAGDRANFVRQFVPLDLSENDTMAYLQDLTTHAEADGQWNNLVAEIAAIRSGKGVDRIEGDQITKAVFYFKHPIYENCDREVAFCCGANGEWRAEG